MNGSALIGIDVGTTSVKALMIGTDGTVLARFSAPVETTRPRPGWAEQDARQWMAAVLAALGRFAEHRGAARVAGIGFTSQVNTHVFVDDRGEPLLPAILWQDGRCAAEAARLDAEIGEANKLAWFGGPVPIDASHAMSRIAHLAAHAPDLYARARHVLLPKDFCILGLTGAAASDPISAVGLTNAEFGYVAPMLALVPGAAERLPPLFDPTGVVGTVRPGLPFAGVPVVTGLMDAWAGMFGLGVTEDGGAGLQCGTSEIPAVFSTRIVPTPGVVLFPAWRGLLMHAAPTQSGGAALAWVGNLIARAPEELSRLAAEAPADDTAPLFLPHLEGERAPLWDSGSRGVFARLSSATGPAALARAVMEGVAFSVRWAFEALEGSSGRHLDAASIGGGGAASNIWCQIRADVLGKALHRVESFEAGATGAAMLAGVGCGQFGSLPEAAAGLVRAGRVFAPDPAMTGYYAHRFEKYRTLYSALLDFNRDF